MNETEPRPLQIAIDGPVAAGKGDIAARLAKEFGLVYVYTGAMYRALAVYCLEQGIPLKDKVQVRAQLSKTQIDLVEPESESEYAFKVLLNDRNVTRRIRRRDARMGASDVSTIAEVRQFMVKRQQEMAQGKRVVMEGRDIGSTVLPEAQLKIYLTASLEERAKRRWLQDKQEGKERSYEEILEETRERDLQDMTRDADPLRKFPDTWELDTTRMTQEQVVEAIKQELKRRNLL